MQALDQCLAREYNIFCHIMRRTVSIDFFEVIEIS
jgi:3-hydroxyisobutyryl-CoA hydrolase